MRERPIIMQGESVRAILAGTKTQTRRVVRLNPAYMDMHCSVGAEDWRVNRAALAGGNLAAPLRCPYGAPGDRLCYTCGHDTHTSTDSWRDQQRLHGGERRENLQSQEVPGLWQDGDCPLAPVGGKSREEELSSDIHEQRRPAQDSGGSSAGVPRVSRASEARSGGSSFGRRSDEQSAGEPVLGYADRAMAGSTGSWAREDGREPPFREVHGRGARASSVGDSRWALQQASCRPCPRCGAVLRSGDRLWVREAWRRWCSDDGCDKRGHIAYRADASREVERITSWRPPLYLPRWASRITLEITEVRVQRVQEISEQDAEAEGIERDEYGRAVNPVVAGLKTRVSHTAVQAYRHAWDAFNAKCGFPWASNPWVWAVTFKRVEMAHVST